MTLNATQLYVKGLLDGLTLPIAELGTLEAHVSYPNPLDQVTPLCFIWGAMGDEKRHTMPRAQPGNLSTGGFKDTAYDIDLWIFHAELADDPNADSLFPVVIDAVRKVLRNTQLMAQLTDSVTGEKSTIKKIGENIKIDYMPARALEDQRMLQYECRMIVSVVEAIQA
ncbi:MULTISPECIES: hypothetical protein [Arthrobacter]|uniref:DUF3168 domain-containing protein n=1 Tax=Arthrobacter terricola TaxID=2547396 RepID=A0A4R5KMU9_9MICC|nr:MULTISPECIES: hypothetical protein [Arthrobacter]MBT8160992.1 hypothetical protein [Arthrobacter sp. GN70]TDF96856.1 hypothetical protein E1809_09030 [Arthrobacter terricola]